MMNKEEWLSKMKEILSAQKNRKNRLLFHSLVYGAPTSEGQDVVDLLMKSYLDRFDGSIMQCCANMPRYVSIEAYYDAYFKYFWDLRNEPDPDEAIHSILYPGRELSDDDIEYVLNKIRKSSLSGELKKEIYYLISSCNFENEHPYSEIYYSK